MGRGGGDTPGFRRIASSWGTLGRGGSRVGITSATLSLLEGGVSETVNGFNEVQSLSVAWR